MSDVHAYLPGRSEFISPCTRPDWMLGCRFITKTLCLCACKSKNYVGISDMLVADKKQDPTCHFKLWQGKPRVNIRRQICYINKSPTFQIMLDPTNIAKVTNIKVATVGS